MSQTQARPAGFTVLLRKSQASEHLGSLEWPRENVETAVLHHLVP
jgi:hypothetical protein